MTRIKANVIINVSHFQHSLFFEELDSQVILWHISKSQLFLATMVPGAKKVDKQSVKTLIRSCGLGPGMHVKTFQLSCLTMFARWFQHATCLTTPKT